MGCRDSTERGERARPRHRCFDGASIPRHEGPHMRAPTLLSLALLTAALACGCGKKPPEAGPGAPEDAGAPVAITPQGKVLQAAENEAPDGGAGVTGAKKAAPAGA